MPAMLRAFVTLFFIFPAVSFISCKNQTSISAIDAELPIQPNVSDSLKKRTSLDLLIEQISKLENLDDKYIGIEGRPSSQPDYSTELLKLTNTDKLLQLTEHKNPLVRFLSFKALHTKSYPELVSVLKKHITDNETFQLFAGCSITPEPVNLSMYNLVKYQLTSKERSSLGKQLKEQLKINKYWAVNLFDASM